MKYKFVNLFIKINTVFIVSIIFSQCAMIVNKKMTKINLYSDTDSTLVRFKDSAQWYTMPTSFKVPRSPNNIYFELKKDTTIKQAVIPSKLSAAYLYGNLYYGYIGWGLDLLTNKMYTYQKENFFPISVPNRHSLTVKTLYKLYPDYPEDENLIVPEILYPHPLGLVQQKISIGLYNSTLLPSQNEQARLYGIWGLNAGINYYFTNGYCLNTDIGIVANSMNTIIIFSRGRNPIQSVNYFIDAQVGSDMGRLHSDIGLAYFNSNYHEDITSFQPNSGIVNYKRTSYMTNNWGISVSGSYRLTEKLTFEANYMRGIISEHNYKIGAQKATLFTFGLLFITNYFPPKYRAGFRRPVKSKL